MAQTKNNRDEKIRRKVVAFLIGHVGDMAMQGTPSYDAQLERWRVPIYCRTARGILLGGEIQLTKRLRIDYVTPRSDMVKNVEQQLRQLEKVRLKLPAYMLNRARIPAN